MIIAVDFDGILCKNKFPEIGEPNYEVISLVRQLIDKGHEVILWTTRNGAELEDAIKWCEDRGLHFTCVNDQAPSNKTMFAGKYDTESRKVYAHVYIDDHNLEFMMRDVTRSPFDNTLEVVRYYLKEGIETWSKED